VSKQDITFYKIDTRRVANTTVVNIINVSMMICVYLVLNLSKCHTRVVLQGIIHVCNFFFNHNVYNMILHVFSSWVCDILDIMKINLSNLSS